MIKMRDQGCLCFFFGVKQRESASEEVQKCLLPKNYGNKQHNHVQDLVVVM